MPQPRHKSLTFIHWDANQVHDELLILLADKIIPQLHGEIISECEKIAEKYNTKDNPFAVECAAEILLRELTSFLFLGDVSDPEDCLRIDQMDSAHCRWWLDAPEASK